MKFKILIFNLLFLIPSFAFAQKGDLRVFVQDSSMVKHPMLLSYISITKIQLFDKKDSTHSLQSVYHRDGYFVFRNVPVGRYEISFKKHGWHGQLSNVEIQENKTQEVNLAIFNRTVERGCIKCKSKDLIPIVYGKSLSGEDRELENQGKLIWAGCVVGENWYCKGCKEWHY